MEIIKDIFEFFITFGLIDGILIYLLFSGFKPISNKNKFILFIIILISSIIKIIMPSMIYQILFFIILFIFNRIFQKLSNFKSIKIVLILFCFVLIFETLYIIIIDLFGIIDIEKVSNNIQMFIILLPNKIFNITILKLLKRRRSLWV